MTVSEISASSEEQSDGIQQVNTAVAQMDQATQQNAALVEEAAAAARDLEHQSMSLEQLMSFFKLDGAMANNRLAAPQATQTTAALNAPVSSRANTAPKTASSAAAKPAPARPLASPASRTETPMRANASAQDPTANWEEF